MFKLQTQPSLRTLKQLIFTNKVLLFCHCNNASATQWLTFKKKLTFLTKTQTLLVKSKIVKNSTLFALSKSQLAAFLAGLPNFRPKPELTQPLLRHQSTLTFDFWGTKLAAEQPTKHTIQKEENLCHHFSRESKKKKGLIKVKILEPLLQGPTFLVGCPDEKTAIQVANFVNNVDSNFFLLGGFLGNTVLTHLDISLLKNINTSIWAELIGVMQNSIAKTFDISQSPAYSLVSICSYIKK